MKAVGEHVLIKKANKKTKLESGLELPDNIGHQYDYGRVLTTGELVEEVCDDEFVLYDPMGVRDILIDPLQDDGLVVAHRSQIYAVVSRQELEDRKLPIP